MSDRQNLDVFHSLYRYTERLEELLATSLPDGWAAAVGSIDILNDSPYNARRPVTGGLRSSPVTERGSRSTSTTAGNWMSTRTSGRVISQQGSHMVP